MALQRWWTVLKDAASLWSSKHAFQLAGALAFYTLFSAAPLLIIVVTMTGVFFGEDAMRGEVATQMAQFIGPDAAEVLESAVRRTRIAEAGILPTLLGVGAILFGSTTVFAQLQASLNQMWDVKPRPNRSGIVVFLLTRLVSFGMVLVVGFLLLVSFLSSLALRALATFAGEWIPIPPSAAAGLDVVLSLGVATVLFAFLFKVLPDVELAWRDIGLGALVTGVLFIAGQYLISLYLTQAGTASLYGAAGSLVALLMWVYYSSLILLFGAAFTRTSVWARGKTIQPSAGAVKVTTRVVEEPNAKGPP